MIRIALSSFLACTVVIVTLAVTWSRPELSIDISHGPDANFSSTACITENIPYLPGEEGYEECTAAALKWIVVRTDFQGMRQRFLVSRKSQYHFVDSSTGNLMGPWKVPLAKPHHQTMGERFDYRGRFVVDVGDVVPRCFFRIDPNSMKTETIVYPDEVDVIGRVTNLTHSRMVLFRGGLDEPLRICLFDLEDMTLINEFELPDRLGFMDSWRSRVAAESYDISPDGRLIALGESWQQEHRLSGPAVTVWDLETGRLETSMTIEMETDQQSMDSVRSARPKIIADSKRRFPVISEQQGHSQIKFSRCGKYIQFGLSKRTKNAKAGVWTIIPVRRTAFDVATGTPVSLSNAFPMDWREIEGEAMVVGADGKRVLWLAEMPTTNPKKARLTDQHDEPVTDWYTIDETVCSRFQDQLWATPVPGTNTIAVESTSPTTALQANEQLWWSVAPEPLRPWAPTVNQAAKDQVVLIDFDSQTHHHVQDFSKQGDAGCDIQCQQNQVAILLNSSGKSRLEIWRVPLRLPQWGLAFGLGVATFLVSIVLLAKSKLLGSKTSNVI